MTIFPITTISKTSIQSTPSILDCFKEAIHSETSSIHKKVNHVPAGPYSVENGSPIDISVCRRKVGQEMWVSIVSSPKPLVGTPLGRPATRRSRKMRFVAK